MPPRRIVRQGEIWAQHAYVKSTAVGTGDGNGGNGDNFGSSVVVTPDALVVGAVNECSRMAGLNPPGGQADNSARQAGAIYLFR